MSQKPVRDERNPLKLYLGHFITYVSSLPHVPYSGWEGYAYPVRYEGYDQPYFDEIVVHTIFAIHGIPYEFREDDRSFMLLPSPMIGREVVIQPICFRRDQFEYDIQAEALELYPIWKYWGKWRDMDEANDNRIDWHIFKVDKELSPLYLITPVAPFRVKDYSITRMDLDYPSWQSNRQPTLLERLRMKGDKGNGLF